jgi:hypothetical protein
VGRAGASVRGQAIALRALPAGSMIAAARAMKAIASDEAARAAPRGVKMGRRRRKLTARDEIRTAGETTTCRVQGRPVGGWVWVTAGTRGHAVKPRKRGPGVLAGPGWSHPVSVAVRHPGSGRRNAWRRVQERSAQVVPEIFRDDVAAVVRG